MRELPTWTIVMTVSWILWRDYKAVTFFHDPSRKGCFYWLENKQESRLPIISPTGKRIPPPPAIPKFELRKLEPASLSDLGAVYRDTKANGADDTAFQCEDNVQAELRLLNSLIMAEISAVGIDNESSALVQIEPHHWSQLVLVSTSASDVVTRPGIRMSRFSDVQLRRQDVERIWPPLVRPTIDEKKNAANNATPKVKIGPKTKDILWAISVLWPDGQIPSTPKVREKAIIDWLSAPERKVTVDKTTIKRCFSNFKPGS